MNIGKKIGMSALLLGLVACSSGDSVEERIASANDYLADANYQAAIIELKNALQVDGQSAEARYLLGRTYIETGDVLSAEKELERAKELGWSGDDVNLGLARVLLAQGKYEEVRNINAEGLAAAEEADLLALKATAALGLGDTWDAERLTDQALVKAPGSVEALMAEARVLSAQNDLEGANTALEQLISRDSEQTLAWSLLGDTRAKRGDFTGALEAYDKAVASREDNYGDMFKRGMLNMQMGNYEAAQADASSLLRKAPQHPGSNYIQGILHFQAGKYEEAITALSVTEPAFKQYPASLFFLGSAQLMQGNLDLAASLAGRFHKLVPDSIRGRKLLATVRLQQGKFSAVESLLRPVLDADPNDVDALNLAANAYLGDGKNDEGIAMLGKVAALQPDSPVAQVRLGAGLLIGGKGDDAAQHIETALDLDSEFQQADILLVLKHMQNSDYPTAISAAQAFARRHATSVTPYNLLGKVYQKAGQQTEAKAAFEQALVLDSADPGANHSLAQMALAENDIATARSHYEAVLATQPDSAPTLIKMAELDAREGKENAMLKNLEKASKVDPTALQPRLLLGRYYLGKGRPEQVAPLFTNLSTRQQQTPEVLRLMAVAQLSSRNKTAAQFTLEQLLASTPDSAPIRYMMAMAVSGDKNRTKQELERALALDENHVQTRIALARTAYADEDMAQFKQHLEKLKTLAPDNPNVLLLLATDARQDGNPQAALGLVQQAFDTAPTRGTLIVLASYQETTGDRDSAIQNYESWLEKHPDHVTVRVAFANSLQLGQHLEEALVQYTAVLEQDPDNAIALNNLAWIVREQDPAQALEYARKASNLVPDSAEALDTLAVVEYLNKNYQRAERTIERALRAQPENPSMLYHSAMIATAQNDRDAARATLRKLMAANPDFPEITEAQALLAKLDEM